MRTCLIIPTLNAEHYLGRFFAALRQQSLQPDEVLVVDSSSSDSTVELCRSEGVTVTTISRCEFDHGGTRLHAAKMTRADILVYMTQDAILEGRESFARLVAALTAENDIGMAYGRQLPHHGAGPLGSHHRNFNYPAVSTTKRRADIPRLGMKACFCSDSFAAYKASALAAVGGFPADVICGEDEFVAARMLLAGFAVRYEASAQVRHSHEYSVTEDFRRYFDLGVFFGREAWIFDAFRGPSSEGARFVLSEVRYLVSHGHARLVPSAILHSFCKWLGFRLGLSERLLPPTIKPRLGMFRGYWQRASDSVSAALVTNK